MKYTFSIIDNFRIVIKHYHDTEKPAFALDLGKDLINISAIIIDVGLLSDQEKLLEFARSVEAGKNTTDEYWTTGYTAKVIEHQNQKLLKVYFRLTDDYPPAFIKISDFINILETWNKEENKFEKNPQKYEEKLRETGSYETVGYIQLDKSIEVLPDL